MAKTIRTKVFSFNELSDDAKQVAIKNYRSTFDDWYFEDRCLADDFNEQLKSIGFENPKVQFSLSHSQGDGLSFSADGYRGLKDLFKGVLGDGKDRTIDILVAYADLSITGNTGRYCYASDSDVELELYDNRDMPNIRAAFEKVRDALSDIYMNECSRLEEQGYGQYEYILSDEYISETLEINGYLFTKDGRTFNY